MKKVLWGVGVVFVVSLAFLLVQGLQRIQAAEVEAAVLIVQRDSAQAQAERAQLQADLLAEEFAALEAERDSVKAAAEARAAVEAARADELEEAISGLLPPEVIDAAVANQVMAAVAEIRVSYELRLADKDTIIRRGETSLTRSRAQVERVNRVNASLREALAFETARADRWEIAAQPLGLLGNLKSNTGLLSGALALGIGIGAVVGG